MGRKPQKLKGPIKKAAIEADRHHPADPTTDPALWARELTTKRVPDLFKTLPGLSGHVKQIQDLINRANKHFVTRTGTTSVGKELYRYIAHAVVMSASDAKFDFPRITLTFPFDMAHLKLSRESGRVIVHSQP